jgi:hypothetical protein
MLIPMSVTDFRPYVEQKIEQLRKEIEQYDNKIQQEYIQYENETNKYYSKPWFIRLFMRTPKNPRLDIFSDTFILEGKLSHKKSELELLEQVLLSLSEREKVYISERDIEYLGINAKKLNSENKQ